MADERRFSGPVLADDRDAIAGRDLEGHPVHGSRPAGVDMDQVLDAWRMGFVDQPFPGGESALLAQHRIRPFAARLVGAAESNDVAVVAHGRINRVLIATVSRHDQTFQLSVLASPAGELQVPLLNAAVGAPVRAYIRARDVMLSLKPPEEISALNVLAGRVAAIVPAASGAQAEVRLDCNGATLTARLTAKSVQRLALAPGQPVFAVIKSVSFERS